MNLSYGEFDTRFPGISLTVDTPERWKNILQYSLGPDTPQNLGSGISELEFTESVACLTVGHHEMRHFHDFLISDIGAHTMRTRLILALNLPQILVNMLRLRILTDADYLPVPLTKWCAMPPDEQASFETDMAAAGYRIPALPRIDAGTPVDTTAGPHEISSASLAKFIAVCTGYQEKLRLLSLPLPGVVDIGLYPIHVWEAAALLVQSEELNGAVGADAVQRFAAIIGQPGNRYGAALKWISEVWPHRGGLPAEIAAIMLGWCLFGDYGKAGNYASPVTRMAMLWNLFRQESKQDLLPQGDVKKIFAAWDRLTSQPPTLTGLRRSLDEDPAFIASVGRRNEQVSAELREEAALMLSAYCEYADAREYMVKRFLAAPEEYLMPRHYLNSLGHWSAPPLKIECLDRATIKFNEENSKDWYIHSALEDQDGTPLGLIVGPPWTMPGVPHISRESAFRLYAIFTVADVVLGPDRADMTGTDSFLARTFFNEEIRVVRVFN